MSIVRDSSDLEAWAFRFLCLSAFGAAFSLPFGRLMLVFSVVALCVACARKRCALMFSAVAWCWIVFALVAVVVSAVGLDPARSFNKLDKLIWFMGIPLSATLVSDSARVRSLLRAFCAGTVVLAVEVLVWRPFAAWQVVNEAISNGVDPDFMWELTDLGSMTDGQILMLGVVAMTGLLIAGRSWWRYLGLATIIAALVVNLKRGSWICTLIIMAAFVAFQLKRRYLLMIIGVSFVILMLPPVWGRLADLSNEFDVARGGRLVMWTEVAPALIKAHPMGIGYRSLTSEMMLSIGRELGVVVESGRNHLHSNPVQILVAMGWVGLAVYCAWMGLAVTKGTLNVVRFAGAKDDRVLCLTVLLMLIGLILNGLVEYNFADGELVILYGILLGLQGTAVVEELEKSAT